MYEKPRWLILNKLDMVADPEDTQKRFCQEYGWNGPVFAISALSGDGTQQLLWALQDALDVARNKEQLAQDIADGTHVPEDPRFDASRDDAPGAAGQV